MVYVLYRSSAFALDPLLDAPKDSDRSDGIVGIEKAGPPSTVVLVDRGCAWAASNRHGLTGEGGPDSFTDRKAAEQNRT